jgi:cell division septation protein DedD
MEAKVFRVLIGLVILVAGAAIELAQYIPGLMASEQIGNTVIDGTLATLTLFVIFWPSLVNWPDGHRGDGDNAPRNGWSKK